MPMPWPTATGWHARKASWPAAPAAASRPASPSCCPGCTAAWPRCFRIPAPTTCRNISDLAPALLARALQEGIDPLVEIDAVVLVAQAVPFVGVHHPLLLLVVAAQRAAQALGVLDGHAPVLGAVGDQQGLGQLAGQRHGRVLAKHLGVLVRVADQGAHVVTQAVLGEVAAG